MPKTQPMICDTGAYADINEYADRFADETLAPMEIAATYAHALLQWCKDNRVDAGKAMSAARTRFLADQPPLK